MDLRCPSQPTRCHCRRRRTGRILHNKTKVKTVFCCERIYFLTFVLLDLVFGKRLEVLVLHRGHLLVHFDHRCEDISQTLDEHLTGHPRFLHSDLVFALGNSRLLEGVRLVSSDPFVKLDFRENRLLVQHPNPPIDVFVVRGPDHRLPRTAKVGKSHVLVSGLFRLRCRIELGTNVTLHHFRFLAKFFYKNKEILSKTGFPK